jgi:hypothetical protein
VFYPISPAEMGNKKGGRPNPRDQNYKKYYLSETDGFFERDLKVIDAVYISKEKNT